MCLLTDVPGICAKVSTLYAVSNRISDGMTSVCMTSDGVCVVCGVCRSVCVKCVHNVCWCHRCVMSAGVTGVCVMPSALTGVQLHVMVDGTLGTPERHPQHHTWYSSSNKNPASPSRFPLNVGVKDLELYNLLYTIDLVNLIVTIMQK